MLRRELADQRGDVRRFPFLAGCAGLAVARVITGGRVGPGLVGGRRRGRRDGGRGWGGLGRFDWLARNGCRRRLVTRGWRLVARRRRRLVAGGGLVRLVGRRLGLLGSRSRGLRGSTGWLRRSGGWLRRCGGWLPCGGCCAAGAADPAAPAEPSSSMTASSAPTATVSSSATVMPRRMPATGDGISVSTLSVETSSSGSSASTCSPSRLSQRVTVPSVTLSPSWGIDTVTDMASAGSFVICLRL